MSTVPSYFNDFLSEIRLTSKQVEDCQKGHTTLRERLNNEENLKNIIVGTILQGSYKRATAIRPFDDKKPDVDIIVVTNLDRDKWTPHEALDLFKPFLEKYYKGKYNIQGRSWGIELSYVNLDLVPTSAPSEVVSKLIRSESLQTNQTLEESKNWQLNLSWRPDGSKMLVEKAADEKWQEEPLWIPDREAQKWDKTHPLMQIVATQTKNYNCNGNFVNVVKCLKWWRTTQRPEPKYPKSYPLEHLCWVNCSEGIVSVAEGVVTVLESIRDSYRNEAMNKMVPFIPDHGVPAHNVLGRISGEDFAKFHKHISEAASVARLAYNEQDLRKSVAHWVDLFGDRFPEPPPKKDDDGGESPDKMGGYTPRKEVSVIGGGRFAM